MKKELVRKLWSFTLFFERARCILPPMGVTEAVSQAIEKS